MTARLLARAGDGTLRAFPLDRGIRIGSGEPSDLVLDGEGVLTVHAKAGMTTEGCVIEAAGTAHLEINGEPATRRLLHHLDVITFGDRVSVIFSTSDAALPGQAAPRRVVAGAAPTAPATMILNRDSVRAAAFPPVVAEPAVAAEPSVAQNTVIGLPAATASPAFVRQREDVSADQPTTPKTIVGVGDVVAPPAFGAGLAPQTQALDQRGTPVFEPDELPTVEIKRGEPAIQSVRLAGLAGVFELPLGRSVIGRGRKATTRIDSTEVSRVHAVLIASPEGVSIEDQGSRNGTAVNGVKITGAHVLRENDLISFGAIELRVDFVRLGGG